jgi:hypothetical protein
MNGSIFSGIPRMGHRLGRREDNDGRLAAPFTGPQTLQNLDPATLGKV